LAPKLKPLKPGRTEAQVLERVLRRHDHFNPIRAERRVSLGEKFRENSESSLLTL
jgi:hypothetical protein